MVLAMTMTALQAKTLVVYYSFTNNCRTIATDLKGQLTDADLVEVQPAEEGLDYAANGFAIGSRLIQAIRNHPNDASSYPAIKPMTIDFTQYDEVVVVTPLWWSNMAAPMQTFLFQNGSKMAGKQIGLIVSSASSGISDVVADAKRLIPNGKFVSEALHITSGNTSRCHSLTADWITKTGIGATTGIAQVNANGKALSYNVYTIDGKNVLAGAKNLEALSDGVYIVNGKKMVIKK